jgi:hypothetical protein
MYDKQSVLDEVPYNKTFFDTIGGVSYMQWKNNEISYQELVVRVSAIFDSWMGTLKEIQAGLSTSGETSKEKTAIEYEGVDFIILSICTAQSAIPLELEKSSKTPILTPHERLRFCSEVEF